TAVAIGYDWLHDVLSPETKQKVVASIKTKALDLAVEEYKTGDNGSWAKRETNWNVVCNAGMTLGALAVAEDYPELAEQIITNAVKYVPNCIELFAPDGVCYEGPAYWGYTNDFLSLLLKSLDDNFRTTFGLSELEGVSQAVMYYISSTSPSGKIFNFANSGGAGQENDPIFFYFSRKFNQPEAAEYYRKILSRTAGNSSFSRFYFLSIPWYDPATVTAAALPKLKVFRNSINDIVVFNGDASAENSIYLIAKTGDPDMAHQQLDVGTFIIETNGVRWSDDTGADSYSLPGFWDYKPDGQRWKYFRNTNFSHNTLSIDNKIQYSAGTGELAAYDEQATQPFVTMDISGVYQGQATSAFRTFCLTGDTRMVITDSVTLNKASQQVCWSMITAADVQCKGNTAVLTKDGKTFFVTLLSPAGASFSASPAKTFTPEENPLEGYTVLSANVTGKQVQVIKVMMSSTKDYTNIN
ncbi:MAG: heparinase II/III-family protein, partial [Tannerella sp.]|nr:heparinase II/III-family protein [Tannerella sp.]